MSKIFSRSVGMRLEERILVECCHAAPHASRLRPYLRQSVDWPLLADLAKWHGLRPLLTQRLAQLGGGNVPLSILVQLRAETKQVACRNLFLSAELVNVLRLFAAQGIQALSLKGPALALAAYGGMECREFEDLDVLIPKESFHQACSVVHELGYQPDSQAAQSEALFFKSNHQLAFTKRGSNLHLELHWSLQERKFLGVDLKPREWLERPATTAVGGHLIQVPALSDLVLFLCLHGAKHAWERWKWIYDIAGLIKRNPDAPWPDILRNAARLGALPIFLVSLALASEFAGVELPGSVQEAMRNQPRLTRQVVSLKQRVESTSRNKTLSTALLQLQMHQGIKTRARYVFQHLFVLTAADWNALRLASPFQFLYPALRPFRLLADHFLSSARRAAKHQTKDGR